MNVLKLIRAAVLALAMLLDVGSASRQLAKGEEPVRPLQGKESPSEGVLLLRDGGVLTGKISQSADGCVVIRGGAELSVPSASVAMICGTLEEAYQRQQSALPNPPTAKSHLILAEWCLGCGLYPQAAEELATARAMDPKLAKLELLERRLAVTSRPASKQSILAAPTTSTADANPSAAREGVGGTTTSPAGDLPEGVVERFTRKVQPVLVNNCTLAGCHRPGGSQSFELDRALLHGMANRRSTMHNLAAVLALVDRERPQESPLLTVPRRDHGGMDHPIFGPRQSAQFQQLVDWVALVTKTSTRAEMPVANGEQAAEPPAESQPASIGHREPIARVSYDKDGKVRLPDPSKQAAAVRATSEKSAEPTGAEETVLPPFTPSPLRYGARASLAAEGSV